jgi:hypothetical protein
MFFACAVGVLSAITVMVVMARIDLKKFMGYPAIMDCFVTALLAILLYGTYTGIVAAIVGGLFFSFIVSIVRRVYGYKRLERKGFKWHWVEYNGTWLNS